MTCKKKYSNTCSDINYAPCVRYEEELPEFTKIDKDCVNLEDTTKDIYEIIGELKEQLPEELKERLEQVEEEVVTLKQKVEQLENKNYCEIDMSSCVEVDGVDPCGDSITTLGAILNDIYSKLPN